jgi:hypothetical protein
VPFTVRPLTRGDHSAVERLGARKITTGPARLGEFEGALQRFNAFGWRNWSAASARRWSIKEARVVSPISRSRCARR